DLVRQRGARPRRTVRRRVPVFPLAFGRLLGRPSARSRALAFGSLAQVFPLAFGAPLRAAFPRRKPRSSVQRGAAPLRLARALSPSARSRRASRSPSGALPAARKHRCTPLAQRVNNSVDPLLLPEQQ